MRGISIGYRRNQDEPGLDARSRIPASPTMHHRNRLEIKIFLRKTPEKEPRTKNQEISTEKTRKLVQVYKAQKLQAFNCKLCRRI